MGSSSFKDQDDMMMEFFKCYFCQSVMSSRIWQCSEGHVICSDCKPKLVADRCPTCRKTMGNIRNRLVERMVEQLSISCCKYTNLGCKEKMTIGRIQDHEKHCRHRPFRCPFNIYGRPCSVDGDIDKLVAHLKDDHGASETTNDEIDMSLHISDAAACKVAVYKCHSKRFCLFVTKEQSSRLVQVNIRFLGEKWYAGCFLCKLETGDDDMIKSTWQGFPGSIREEDKYYGLIFAHPSTEEMAIEVRIQGSIGIASS